jgi:uncharacterized membrane protein YgcG
MPVTIISNPAGTNTPVGAVIAWFGSLSGVPTLPSGWQLCDGSQITDARSPMKTQYTPNINGNSEATKFFMRGSTTSGTTGGSYNGAGDLYMSGGGSSSGPGYIVNSRFTVIPPFIEAIFIMRIF